MSTAPDKYLVSVRRGGWHNIRPTGGLTSDEEAKAYRDFVEACLLKDYNSRKGRAKGAKPFVYVWKLVE